MDDNSLDSFINSVSENASQTNVDTIVQTTNRPKLRKIKRPKQRTTTDIPLAPQKIMPENIDLGDLEVEKKQDEFLTENSNEAYIQTKETSLVTAKDANDMASSLNDNPYVLEALPPDLDYIDDTYENDYSNMGYVKKNVVFIASAICLSIGLFIGKTFFSYKTVEKHGLEGVVINEDVPAGRPRCGLTDRSQACVFYLMNWYKQELNGRDFYKLAAQLTGREEYLIETGNMRYATVKIKPGNFAQLNIPALK